MRRYPNVVEVVVVRVRGLAPCLVEVVAAHAKRAVLGLIHFLKIIL